MSVTMAPMANRLWQGLSSDTKPTGSRVQVNDILYLTDTQVWYVYTAAGTWAVANTTPPMRSY
jgi:hypothetical protein